jgi:23S rRNA pseudouridine2604 synthase
MNTRREHKQRNATAPGSTLQSVQSSQAPRDLVTPNDSQERPRLSKRMAELGLCSRREADEWIEKGWVRVDGKPVTTLGSRVDRTQSITIERAARRAQRRLVTILLHKPVGYVSGQAEDGYRPAVTLIGASTRWRNDAAPIAFDRRQLQGIAPAGRLDIESTGLLVLTQDGRIARRLIGEDSDVEKEYLVRVEGQLAANGLARLRHGLALDGHALRRAEVDWQNEAQLRFVLREGRKRQIRRMCEMVGLSVVALKRVRIGHVRLGSLPLGKWRYLGEGEAF